MRSVTISRLISFIFVVSTGYCQEEKKEKIYKINYFIDVPVTAALVGTNYLGLLELKKKDKLTTTEVNSLNADDIHELSHYQNNTFVQLEIMKQIMQNMDFAWEIAKSLMTPGYPLTGEVVVWLPRWRICFHSKKPWQKGNW